MIGAGVETAGEFDDRGPQVVADRRHEIERLVWIGFGHDASDRGLDVVETGVYPLEFVLDAEQSTIRRRERFERTDERAERVVGHAATRLPVVRSRSVRIV